MFDTPTMLGILLAGFISLGRIIFFVIGIVLAAFVALSGLGFGVTQIRDKFLGWQHMHTTTFQKLPKWGQYGWAYVDRTLSRQQMKERGYFD